MAKKEDLIKEAEGLGIELDSNETVADLKAKIAAASAQTTGGSEAQDEANVPIEQEPAGQDQEGIYEQSFIGLAAEPVSPEVQKAREVAWLSREVGIGNVCPADFGIQGLTKPDNRARYVREISNLRIEIATALFDATLEASQ